MTPRPILAVVGLKREARIVASSSVVTLCGGGAPDLADRIEAAIEAHRPRAMLSFGLAGALAPGLQPGDLVIGSAVLAAGARFECDPEWRTRLVATFHSTAAPSASGDERDKETLVFAADRMITAAAEKQALHASTGAAIVDMESADVARAASAHGLPFAVIRAVSDSADQTLPKAVLSGMRPDGGMNLAGVLASLARDPRQLPALIRAGAEAERGFKALDDARRLLGPGIGLLDLGELLLDVG